MWLRIMQTLLNEMKTEWEKDIKIIRGEGIFGARSRTGFISHLFYIKIQPCVTQEEIVRVCFTGLGFLKCIPSWQTRFFLQIWYFEIREMWHNAAWPRAKPIDWSRINPLAKDYDLFLMHNLEGSHIRILIGLRAGDYFFSPSFFSLTAFMLFPHTQCRPQLGSGVFLYFPTTCLNQMSNTCSAANIITANLLSHNSLRLPFPKRFPPSSSLSPFLYMHSNLCECQFIKSAVQKTMY